MTPEYDPLAYDNIGTHLAEKLMEQPLVALPPDSFNGNGVYALFFSGNDGIYRPISTVTLGDDNAPPIYVGKAIPGGRRGQADVDTASTALYDRLGHHAQSITQAENLDLGDFRCRYLVVVPVWVQLAENLLIRKFSPLWNVHVSGFGNNAPGSGRSTMRRPDWDTLHPGRPWAASLAPGNDIEEIRRRILAHMPRPSAASAAEAAAASPAPTAAIAPMQRIRIRRRPSPS